MSYQAYRTASSRSESPRELEYRLFGEVTRALMAASEKPREDLQARAGALAWNRSVWSALANDCAHEGNGLPESLRAGIISLALFVRKYSGQVMREGADMEPLIDINRTVMQGLAPHKEADAA